MKVVIGTGGTGGHLYPAIAFVEYIQKQQPDVEVLFVGTTDRIESRVVPEMGYPYKGLFLKGIAGGPFDKMNAIRLFVLSVIKAKKILKEFQPDIVIGFGGYPSASIVKAAQLLKIKTMIHEQNSVVGLTNKILIKDVDGIVCCYQKALDVFPSEKTFLYGNPRASIEVENDESIFETYKLSKKYVVVVMGSMGSSTINEVVLEMIEEMKHRDYTLLYITGEKLYHSVVHRMRCFKDNVTVVPYIDDLPPVLQQATLVVSRAGASTIAEITSMGVPSLLIPSPYVTANHQYHNAMELVEQGASYMIEESNLTMESCFKVMDEMMANDITIESMKQQAKRLGKKDACKDMYNYMMELVGDNNV